MKWHSIHVHYHDPERVDALVLDGIRPLLSSVAEDIKSAYFVRHWLRGPHIRVNVLTEPDIFWSRVRPAAERVLGDFLARSPSRSNLDAGAELPAHQRLARLESESAPLVPWQPDNSILVAPYDDRARVLGSRIAAQMQAAFLADTTQSTLDMLEQVRRGGQRLRIAFDLMIASAHRLSGLGIRGGCASFRSHAEAFLGRWPEGEGRRAAWDRYYRVHAGDLAARVRAVVGDLDAGSGAIPFIAVWAATLEGYRGRYYHLVRTGELAPDLPGDPAAVQQAEERLAKVSAYYRALSTNETWKQHGRPARWFAAYRLVLNYTYLQLTRLGVTPPQRYLLCHLAASATEDVYDFSLVAEAASGRFLQGKGSPR